ncbi:pyruvate kinase [Paenibacillus faecalis]|uniref:pyruvate kinase n=1 Tax=Paenibacillus faecalis TaxID=2079532 RepID=UPI00131A5D6A|nr:pyruvate kinase [Paenibacillus faecalis]
MNIVATIKPKKETRDIVNTLLELGVSSFRINFGRGAVNENLRLIEKCKRLSENMNIKCTLFADLPGAKKRLGKFENSEVRLREGDEFCVDKNKDQIGNENRVSINDMSAMDYCEVGDRIMISDDDQPILEITRKGKNTMICTVLKECRLYNHCGITINHKYIAAKQLSTEDKQMIKELKGISDFICPSFVDSKTIVDEAKSILGTASNQKIIAKIETPVGISKLDEILYVANGIMLCRGDLKHFYSLEKINQFGEMMKQKCSTYKDKLLIFATDYFESMINGEHLSKYDEEQLNRVLTINPDYLILNETAYAANWKSICKTAINKMLYE